ncbi:MmcQ/YjbR family DNA-binding protein [Sphingomonas sp. CGMCC 1.13654]|uniref:MmcQ/YjbR family DNA-binding protein n=1 Tax=Sphingomonas chungangi TaxID=2683589 RepID=A0A838L8F0_9SPHN|nr:MmcQ/YjbR family DNA-binding protein [Sphingomonas chungangi]MBA2935012.1 MmcQ/YjbR family DNA-binding protein [Sphingomonas chungangi]MVW54127.1 hypothetical protein [Sphingomonas chungangi]
MIWDDVVAHALTLPGTELTAYYGGPAVKANGHPLVTPGREKGSFCLHIDQDTKAILMETSPETFWQTSHYDGWPSVLVRYDSADPERVLAMIERSHDWAMSRKRPRPRKR